MKFSLAAAAMALSLAVVGGVVRAQPQAEQSAGLSAEEKKQREEAAVKLHDEARALYERGEYRAAITKLEAAHALDPEGSELVYNLALIHEKLGDIDDAELYYKRYLEMETDEKIRERVQNILRRLEGAKHEVKPPPSESETAARPPPSVAPASSPPRTIMRRPIGPWVWATGGLAISAFLASGVFAIEAASKNPGSNATTGNGVTIDDLDAQARSAHHHAVLADVALAVGALAGGAALYIYLTTPMRPVPAKNAVTLLPHIDLATRGVRVTF